MLTNIEVVKTHPICSVSVIIPFYNAASSVSASLKSVFSQTVLPSEIIIVDDCSDKKEIAILKQIVDRFNSIQADKVEITLLTLNENKGASFARNIAIKKSTMKYLAFLDADDVWANNKIEVQYGFMEGGDFFMTGHGYIFDLNKEKFSNGVFSFSKINKYQFIYTNPFFTPTVMALREGFKLFDESFRRADDYKCWLDNFGSRNVAKINIKLAGGFKHPIGVGGLSGSFNKMHLAHIDVLKSLYAERVISAPFYYVAKLVEIFKYPLRLILSKI